MIAGRGDIAFYSYSKLFGAGTMVCNGPGAQQLCRSAVLFLRKREAIGQRDIHEVPHCGFPRTRE